MKKIFMASICAIMAVTAANADIASTTYVGNAIGALDANQVGADGSYIKLVSQADGKVSASAEAFVDEINEETQDSSNAPSVAAVTGYVTEELAVVTGQDGISGLKTAVQNLNNGKADKATTLAGYGITDAYTKTQVDGFIGDATKAGTDASAALAEYKTANDAKVNKNTEDIAALDTKYVSETEMTAFKGQNTTAIATAKTEAIDAAGTAADGKITEAVGALDVTEVTATDGNYFNAYAETDGKISMKQKTFEATLADNVKNAPQTGAVKSYVDTKVSGGFAELDATVNAIANQVVTGVVEEDGKLKSVSSTQITDAYVAENAGIAQSKIAGLTNVLDDKLDKNALEDAAKKAAGQGDGEYSLTMKVVNNKIEYQWDKITY